MLAGGFVLAARPNAGINRFFFLLALADGTSTALYQLAVGADDAALRVYFRGTYWYFQIAFVALLVTFGLTFPRPWGAARARRIALASVAAAAVAAEVAYALDHSWVWEPLPGGAFRNALGANAILVAFVLATALLAARLVRIVERDPSPSFRHQGAFVLGGMILAYAPYATTQIIRAVASRPIEAFATGGAAVVAGHWSALVLVAALAFVAYRLFPPHGTPARFVLGALVGVAVLTALTAVTPGARLTYVAQRLGLLAYPVLLGYAIARYEVFDIDAHLRRAATVTLALGGLVLAFLVLQESVQSALAERVLGFVPSPLVASGLSAVAVSALSWPVVRAARRVARRVVPTLGEDAARARKLELYRHGVEGALADGILAERESRTLAVLRESLGVTAEEHERVLAEVIGRRAPAARPAPPP